MIDKKALFQQIVTILEQEFTTLVQAAQAAHEAATHEESKSEDRHDTRGLESSYLAGAQAHRAAEVQQALSYFRQLEPRRFGSAEPVSPGAIIRLRTAGRDTLYLLALYGAGMRVTLENRNVLVISPHSPLGEELIGRHAGDLIEVESQGSMREYEIASID